MTTTTPTPASAAESGVWNRVRPLRVSDEIVRQFRRALFEGRIHAGDLLGSEKRLAAQFGVSRTTIRDALRFLEASGLIEIRTGAKGGVRVASGDPLRFADLMAMQLQLVGVGRVDVIAAQLGLESGAAELAAGRADAEDLRQLERLLEASSGQVDSGEYRDYGYAFHEAVARASHNWPVITALHAILELRREPPTDEAPLSPRRARRLVEVHREIFEAIRGSDAEKASRLMRQHLRANLERPRGLAGVESSLAGLR